MSKSIVVGSTLAVLGLGGLAFGAWQMQDQAQGPAYADIVNVQEITRTVETPREVCEDVQKQVPVKQPPQQAQSSDPNKLLGSAAGAVVGGLLGNQVGGGTGKKLATAAGAIGGGLAGREVQERVENRQRAQAGAGQPQTRTVTREECRTVVDTHQESEGYKVSWRDDSGTHTTRLEERPEGDQVELEEGSPNWQKTRTARQEA
ncbi:glycine zipper 2TM domain-containing protein [Halomonas piscis]|uniref:Glycine zipper 2TM domain-containing protein n=1 Tax=Halomonas piscis TaxID=3031727 RepID=A0ABY9Z2R8_9GAMM|nr:glycine zipper 2TM domain-containing protein [Halomonas piscis]WNK20976.1 glycine zipper 2TM domain-containing protein [Halomonas piscis]